MYPSKLPLRLSPHQATDTGKFGRMFPHLDAWRTDKLPPDTYLKIISNSESFIFTPEKDPSLIPAGYTYLGQFLAHDISFDPTTVGERLIDRDYLLNYRTPALDLDSLYGGGPRISPYLYDRYYRFQMDTATATTDEQSVFFDLPRYQKRAIIPDNRNDENPILSQLHLAFMAFHNKMIDEYKEQLHDMELFLEARRQTVWHYQYVIVHDYLRRILGEEEWEKAIIELRSNTFNYQTVFIPLEFASAIFRFGHSQVRETYQFNPYTSNREGLPIQSDAPPPFYLDWRFFFGEGYPLTSDSDKEKWPFESIKNNFYQSLFTKHQRLLIPGHQISPKFVNTLKVMGHDGMQINLVEKNFLRGLKYGLPSGQTIARALGIEEVDWKPLHFFFYSTSPAATKPKFPEAEGLSIKQFQENTPLYYYVLAEAKQKANGNHLGPLGAHIVKNVLLALLVSDPNSYINQHLGWTPDQVKVNPSGNFSMADFLQMAGIFHGALASKNSNLPQPSL